MVIKIAAVSITSHLLPSVNLLDRLYKCNGYLITNHHPLRETLIVKSGFTEQLRRGFLQDAYSCATLTMRSWMKWEPIRKGIRIF